MNTQNKNDLYKNQAFDLNPSIWGPHFWFVLHSIAITYPNNPTETMRKKCYDFIQNFALFLPNENIGNYFLELLDKFPVTPYLDNRLSLMKWVHFIHNNINKKLGKPEMDFFDSLDAYYDNYKVIETKNTEYIKHKKYILYGSFSFLIVLGIYYIYNK
jgi:hypothetical protein